MLRTLLRAALVAVLLATLLLPATPAAAATASYTLTSAPVSFTRGTQTYQMTISATQWGAEGDSMSISISKVSDPRGTAWARQDQSYSWSFAEKTRFVPLASGNKSTLLTSTEMGDFGNIALTLQKSQTVNEYCNRTLKQYPGTFSGSVNFKTGTSPFGEITVEPTKGTLTYNTGTNCYAPGQSTNACPPRDTSVSGYRYNESFTRYHAFTASLPAATTLPASLSVFQYEPLPAAQTNAPGKLMRSITTKAPRSDVAFTGLGSATIQGEAGTWISGSATFKAGKESASNGQVNPCAGGKEYFHTYRSGLMNGNLSANMFTGPDLTVGTNMTSTAVKTTVRAQ